MIIINDVNSKVDEKRSSLRVLTLLLIVGILISYIHQMAPAPFMSQLASFYGIDPVLGQAQLNLSISIIFPCFIIASILGGLIERKIGTRRLYTVAMIFLIIGMLINYIAKTYTVFLTGRVLFGLGFGIAIPVIGSAIMKWYKPKGREKMTTVNGIFPFVGTVISFGLLIPISILFRESWQAAMGIWGIVLAVICLLWLIFVKRDVDLIVQEDLMPAQDEKGLYINLWKRRDIKLLCVAFVCDFMCYAYMAAILPLLLMNSGNMSEGQAGMWAALAFPAVGIVGASIGGWHIATSGKRKPSMAVGQLFKFIGICIMCLLGSNSVLFVIFGAALFGFGNSMWMPGMYVIPTELENMNSTRVGAAFAFISSCGFISGTIAPVLGGYLSTLFIINSTIVEPAAQLSFGLKWSLFIFGFLNLIGFICILKLRETANLTKISSVIE